MMVASPDFKIPMSLLIENYFFRSLFFWLLRSPLLLQTLNQFLTHHMSQLEAKKIGMIVLLLSVMLPTLS